MKRLGLALVLTLAFGLWPALVSAASVEKAEALFARGDFLAAADEGRTVASAAGLALAARATLAYVEFRAPPTRRGHAVRAAEALAREALAKDPEHVEALIQLSLAIGYRARRNGALVSHLQGLVAEGRGYLKQAVALQPDNAWANAALGALHIEVFRVGGSALASALYESSDQRGLALFRRALEIEPENAVLHYEFALALLSIDSGSHADEAEIHLVKAVGLSPETTLDRLAGERAKRLLKALQSERRSKLAGEIRRIRDIRSLARENGRREVHGK